MAETVDNPVTVETPLETLETPLETVETPLETLETPLETPHPKKKGRPVGAKSSVQGKPRPKRVAANRVRKESTLEDEPEPDVHELPPPLPNSRRIPQVSHDDSSALMLTLLSRSPASEESGCLEIVVQLKGWTCNLRHM